MTWWEGLILGVIQGLTEFFPVSSSGHLVITERVLGLAIPGIAFEVAVHVATLISVLVAYREKVWTLCRGCVGAAEESSWPYIGKLFVASIPAGVVGVLFKDWFEARFDDPRFAATMILVTGCIVWSSRWTRVDRPPAIRDLLPVAGAVLIALLAGTIVPFLSVLAVVGILLAAARLLAGEWKAEPRWGGAALMGVAQAMAILPGISRSGSTVVTGLWRRIDAASAAEFSFLMSIPAILGAAALSLPDAMEQGIGVPPVALLTGFVAAMVSGVLAIRFFVALLKRQNFYAFAWYCWGVGALFLFLAEGGT